VSASVEDLALLNETIDTFLQGPTQAELDRHRQQTSNSSLASSSNTTATPETPSKPDTPAEPEKDEKKRLRAMRNRQHAAVSRARKRKHTEALERENERLRLENEDLRKRLCRLEEALASSSSCPERFSQPAALRKFQSGSSTKRSTGLESILQRCAQGVTMKSGVWQVKISPTDSPSCRVFKVTLRSLKSSFAMHHKQ